MSGVHPNPLRRKYYYLSMVKIIFFIQQMSNPLRLVRMFTFSDFEPLIKNPSSVIHNFSQKLCCYYLCGVSYRKSDIVLATQSYIINSQLYIRKLDFALAIQQLRQEYISLYLKPNTSLNRTTLCLDGCYIEFQNDRIIYLYCIGCSIWIDRMDFSFVI